MPTHKSIDATKTLKFNNLQTVQHILQTTYTMRAFAPQINSTQYPLLPRIVANRTAVVCTTPQPISPQLQVSMVINYVFIAIAQYCKLSQLNAADRSLVSLVV